MSKDINKNHLSVLPSLPSSSSSSSATDFCIISDITTAPSSESSSSSTSIGTSVPPSSSNLTSRSDLQDLIHLNSALSEKFSSSLATTDPSNTDIFFDFDFTTEPITEISSSSSSSASSSNQSASSTLLPSPFLSPESPTISCDEVVESSQETSTKLPATSASSTSPTLPPIPKDSPNPSMLIHSDSHVTMEALADLLQNIDLPSQQSLFWVPAHRHPEIAPLAFKEWLKKHNMNVDPVASKLNRRKSYKDSTQIFSFEMDPSSGEDKVVVSPVQGPNFLDDPLLENITENPTSSSDALSSSLSNQDPPISTISTPAYSPPRFPIERPLKRSLKRVSRPKKDSPNKLDTLSYTPSSQNTLSPTSLKNHSLLSEVIDLIPDPDITFIDESSLLNSTFPPFPVENAFKDRNNTTNEADTQDSHGSSSFPSSKKTSELSFPTLLAGHLSSSQNLSTISSNKEHPPSTFHSTPNLSTSSNAPDPPDKATAESLKKPKRKLSFFRILEKKKTSVTPSNSLPTTSSTKMSLMPTSNASIGPSIPSLPLMGSSSSASPSSAKDAHATSLVTPDHPKDKFTTPKLFSWLFHSNHPSLLTSSSSSSSSTPATSSFASPSSSTSFFKSSIMPSTKSKSTVPPLALPVRYPTHLEKALCRLSQHKLSNPKRPLYHQVLISNLLVYWLSLNPLALDPVVIPKKKTKHKKKKIQTTKRTSSLVPPNAKSQRSSNTSELRKGFLKGTVVPSSPLISSESHITFNIDTPIHTDPKRNENESSKAETGDTKSEMDESEDGLEDVIVLDEDDLENEEEDLMAEEDQEGDDEEDEEEDDLPLGLMVRKKNNKNDFANI